MAKKTSSEQNIQLSRLLFDKSANYFYSSIGLEIIAGIYSIIFSIITISDNLRILSLIINCLILIVSYICKLTAEDSYDIADTIRRQSVLTEGLNWSISKSLLSDWRQKAGIDLVNKLKLTPLEPGYYSTARETGPDRLAEMILESSFYTRFLYIKLKKIINLVTFSFVIMVLIIISVSATSLISNSVSSLIVKIVYAIIPIYLSINIFGWSMRLDRLIQALHYIEEDLDRLIDSKTIDKENVLRIKAEYDCQVISGIPIHFSLFNHYRNEIRTLWSTRMELEEEHD